MPHRIAGLCVPTLSEFCALTTHVEALEERLTVLETSFPRCDAFTAGFGLLSDSNAGIIDLEDEHAAPHRQFGGHVASGNPSAQHQSAFGALNNPNYLPGLVALSDFAAGVSPGDLVRLWAIADTALELSGHQHTDMDPDLLLFRLQTMKD